MPNPAVPVPELSGLSRAVRRAALLLASVLVLVTLGTAPAHAVGTEWSPYLPKRTTQWGDCAIAVGFAKDSRAGSGPTWYGAVGASNVNCRTVKASIVTYVYVYFRTPTGSWYQTNAWGRSGVSNATGFGQWITTTNPYLCGDGYWQTLSRTYISGYAPVDFWSTVERGRATRC